MRGYYCFASRADSYTYAPDHSHKDGSQTLIETLDYARMIYTRQSKQREFRIYLLDKSFLKIDVDHFMQLL